MRTEYPIFPLDMDHVVEKFAARARRDITGIDMCLGASSFDPRSAADLSLGGDELAALCRYGDPIGLGELRAALSEHYGASHGADIDPSRILITEGATGALLISLILLLEPGDNIIVPEVCFPPYRVLAHMLGATSVDAPLTPDRQLDVAATARLINKRTRALILNTPSNPFGIAMTKQTVDAAAALGVPVVFDEVYQPLGIDGDVPSAIRHHGAHFICNSFSKSFAAAGLRVGYVVVPEAYQRLAIDVRLNLGVSTSLPAQLIALRLLRAAKRLLPAHAAYLRSNRDQFLSACEAQGLRTVVRPTAGIFATLEMPAGLGGSKQFALELADEYALAVAPGSDFSRQGTDFLRVNFASPPELLASAAQRIGQALAARRTRMTA